MNCYYGIHHVTRPSSVPVGHNNLAQPRPLGCDESVYWLMVGGWVGFSESEHWLTHCQWRLACRSQCCQLLSVGYSASLANLVWFTDGKLFTIAALSNSPNDHIYIPAGVHEKNVQSVRLLRTQPTSSKSGFRSACPLGQTGLHPVDPGLKINGQYYRNVLLHRGLHPNIK